MEEGGRVDGELPVNRKVLWDRGADKIQLNKPNRNSPGPPRPYCTVQVNWNYTSKPMRQSHAPT